MTKVIWLRDKAQTATVEWYISDKKAIGVENIREEWCAIPVAESKQMGFAPRKDRK